MIPINWKNLFNVSPLILGKNKQIGASNKGYLRFAGNQNKVERIQGTLCKMTGRGGLEALAPPPDRTPAPIPSLLTPLVP